MRAISSVLRGRWAVRRRLGGGIGWALDTMGKGKRGWDTEKRFRVADH